MYGAFSLLNGVIQLGTSTGIVPNEGRITWSSSGVSLKVGSSTPLPYSGDIP